MTVSDNYDRIPSRERLYSIIDRVYRLYDGKNKADVQVSVNCIWEGSSRWARNRVHMSLNRTDYLLSLGVTYRGVHAFITTNQIDDESIRSGLKFCEWKSRIEGMQGVPADYPIPQPQYSNVKPSVWSDNTANFDFMDIGAVVQDSCMRAEESKLMTAGFLKGAIGATAYREFNNSSREWSQNYVRLSKCQCSMTTRDPKGAGSGWAGKSEVDLRKIDVREIADRAYDKCVLSLNPVRIEPGRYTAILESQAVSDLISWQLFGNGPVMSRRFAETNRGHASSPFMLGFDPSVGLVRSKLGLKIVDSRISVWHDPLDPELGVPMFDKSVGLSRIDYIKDGVLTALAYDSLYSANRLEKTENLSHRASYRMSGGDSTIEDMIANTSRGILVTRLSQAATTHAASLASTGLTRDGLWLIENGKISHALRNFRTLESPLFALNNVESIGIPTKVFTGSHPIFDFPDVYMLRHGIVNFAPQFIVPPLKVRDFSFAGTIDAV